VTTKRLVPRAAANFDIDSAFEHYLVTAGADIAEGFIDAVESAYAHISRYPATGSPRWGLKLNVPGLRSWPLTRYPYMVFHLERRQEVDVLRVLHGAADIPEWLDH
jgi:toxin ParE1/3/4